jgi:hypothetical protein
MGCTICPVFNCCASFIFPDKYLDGGNKKGLLQTQFIIKNYHVHGDSIPWALSIHITLSHAEGKIKIS